MMLPSLPIRACSVRKLSNLEPPGRSTTRVIERFQKSSCSEIARTPLYDWSSVTSPTSQRSTQDGSPGR